MQTSLRRPLFHVLPRKVVITPQVLRSCLLEGFSASLPAAAQPVEGAGNAAPLVLVGGFPAR